MQFWLGLATGVLVGWLSEWLVGLRQRNDEAEMKDLSLHRELDAARRHIAELQAEQISVETTPPPPQQELSTSSPPQPALDRSPALANTDTLSDPDGETSDLTVIKGIGPVFARRLHQAGIDSLEALASTTPEEVRAAAQATRWQKIDVESWIAEAQGRQNNAAS